MPEEVLRVEHLFLDLEHTSILRDISLSVYKNDFLGILGPSGAGKTTLLKALIGFYQPKSGAITFQGKDLQENIEYVRRNVGFATQRHAFYEDLTLQENLAYFGKLYGLTQDVIQKRTDELLALVELTPSQKKKAMHLSGGMQRRLDIACALMHDPDILFLDEPFTGLDPQLREHIIVLVKKIWARGKTIVMSSHFINEIEGQCQRVCILKEGQLVALGTPLEIRKNVATVYEVIVQTAPGNYQIVVQYLMRKGLRILKYTLKEGHLILYLPKEGTPQAYLRQILVGLPEIKENLLNVKLDTLSFEELFTELLAKKQ